MVIKIHYIGLHTTNNITHNLNNMLIKIHYITYITYIPGTTTNLLKQI